MNEDVAYVSNTVSGCNEKDFARRLVLKWGTKLNGNKLKVFRCPLAGVLHILITVVNR